MALRWVKQESSNGCFVAAVAMLLGVSYGEAFSKMFSSRAPERNTRGGVKNFARIEKLMTRANLQFKESRARRFLSMQQNALVIIRWDSHPHLGHCFAWDASTKTMLDPIHKPGSLFGYSRNEIEPMIFRVYYVVNDGV